VDAPENGPDLDQLLPELFRTTGFSARAPLVTALAARTELLENGEVFSVNADQIPQSDVPLMVLRLRPRMPGSITLHGMSRAQIQRRLNEMESALAGYRSFAGIALHDFAALQSLTDSGTKTFRLGDKASGANEE
jgi:hypothetical protein